MLYAARHIVPVLCTVLATLLAPQLSAQSPCSLEQCNIDGFGNDARVLWIPGLPGPANHRFFFEDGDGHFETFPNGTAHVYGQTFNEVAPDHKLYIDVWFTERADWNTWESLGRGWKGDAATVGDLYQTWDYYIMHPDSSNTLTASGGWEGVLSVTHRPESYYYGFQVGQAANDQNAEMGMSVWMDYSGNIDGDWVYGNCDINGEGGCEVLPLLECAADAVIECGLGSDPQFTGEPVVPCPETMTLTYTDTEAGFCPTIVTRTWTVTTSSGETESCAQTITIEDTTAPEFGAFPTLEAADCEAPVLSDLPEVSDACDQDVEVSSTVEVLEYAEAMCGQFRTQTPGGWGASASGNNPGTYRDAHFEMAFPNGLEIGCNNTLLLTTSAAVEAYLPAGGDPSALPNGDMINPTGYGNSLAHHLVALKLSLGFDALDPTFSEAYSSLGSLTLNSGAYAGTSVQELVDMADAFIGGCEAGLSASSLNDALASINENYVDGSMDGGQLDCPQDGICGDLIIVTYTAVDNCGNATTQVQTLALPDTTAPEITTVFESQTVDCNSIPEPFIEATDCGQGEITWTVETNEFSGACLPTINYNYTVSDACGNSATASQFITVTDLEAPVFLNQPIDLQLECGEEVPAFELEVEDNCDQEPSVTLSESTEAMPCGEMLLQTWTATDHCGNASQVSRSITFTDTAGPVLVSGLPSTSLSCEEAQNLALPIFADACGEVSSVEVEVQTEGEGCSYDALYIWTATDACGNTSITSQTITVSDATPPVFSGLEAQIDLQCGEALPEPNAAALDNCSEVTMTTTDIPAPELGCGSFLRTYTAEDACGNTATFNQSLVVADLEPPVFSNLPADFEGSCSANPVAEEVSATDNCSSAVAVTLDEQQTAVDCGLQITRTWTASDDCGNSATHTQTITLTDTQAPLFSGDVLVNASCDDDLLTFISVTDDCDSEVALSVEEEVSGDLCSHTHVRTYTATDDCGNTSTFLQTIHVSDNQPPVFVIVAEDYALSCGDEIPPVEAPVVEDVCGSVVVTFAEETQGADCGLLIQRTWTATDACGNSATATQVVYLGDNVPPVFVNAPEDINLSCSETLPAPVDPEVLDDCGAVTLNFMESTLEGSCAGNYQIQRTWIATDGCGNSATTSHIIHVTDTEAPVFNTEVPDVVAQCGDIPPPAIVTTTDNCGAATINFTETFESGGCPNIIRTWTATDGCGNSTMLVQSVLVEDNEPPVLEGIITLVDTDCNNIPEVPEPEVSDNCDDDVAVTYTENIMGTGCEFTIIRTWIASDDCGNTTIVSQSVNVQDTESPVFLEAPEALTLECDMLESVPFPTVVDDCGETVSMSFVDTPNGEGCTYDIERVWTAQDACGNQTMATQILHVVDQTPPVLSGIPANSYASCGNVPEPVMPLVQDACSEVVNITFDEVQLGEGCSYTLQRTWTATDACGNAISIARLVFVQDDTAPVFLNVPDDISDACAGGEAPEVQHPDVLDSCDSNPDVQFSEFTEVLECGEQIIRTWVATDACGNQKTAQQTITLSDTEAPALVGVPAPAQVICDAIPAPAQVTAVDACGNGAQLFFSETIEGGFCPYILRRTWSAVDACGNTAVAVQEIEVSDDVAPVLVGTPEDITVACGMVPEATLLDAVDNCSGVVVTLSEEWVASGCVSILARTWTATDPCGNASSYTQHIEVVDQTPPTFTQVPEDLVIFCGDPDPVASVGIEDDCAGGSLLFEETILTTECASDYSVLRTWMATDVCGNTSMITQVIEVVDVFAPVWPDAPEDLVVSCDEIPELPELVITGECDENVVVTVEETVVELGDGSAEACALGNATTEWSTVALWLPGLDGFGTEYVFAEEAGTFTQDFDAGTAHVTGQVYDPNMPGNSWIIDIHLEDRLDWSAWSESGGGYKDDLGFVGDLYQTWDYYKLSDNSQLVGADHLEGSLLNLTHAPANYSYGFQVGEAANNRNGEWGMSGWFFYTGFVQGEPMVGVGDVMTENACCSDHDIVRTWTLTDCAGNARTYSQLIEVRQDLSIEPMLMFGADDAGEGALDVWGSEGDFFRIAFTPEASGDYTLTICNDIGVCIANRELHDLKAGERIVVAQSKRDLPPGTYVFAAIGRDSKHTDREMVLR